MSDAAAPAKRGGFLSGLKSLVVEEVPDKAPEAQETPPSRPATSAAPIIGAPRVTPVATQMFASSGADPEMRQKILEKLDQGASPAYQAFAKQLQILAGVFPGNEDAQYKAAIATAQLTAPQLVEASDGRLQALQSLETASSAKLDQNEQERVGSAETEIARIDGEVQSVTQQITQLQTSLSALAQARAEKSGMSQVEEERIRTQRAQLGATIAQVRAEFERQKQTASRYAQA